MLMNSKKKYLALVSVLLILSVSLGMTVAFLVTNTDSVKNTFTPTKVTTKVEEKFENNIKSNVNVTNTGDIDAYVRVNLVTYRVNDKGEKIGGTATIPHFTPGEGWLEGVDGLYYYTMPVVSGGTPKEPLISSITLQSYSDADGGKQVIEVMAEGIQADGGITDADGTVKPAVVDAWGKANGGAVTGVNERKLQIEVPKESAQ